MLALDLDPARAAGREDQAADLDADSYPPAVNLRPAADWPDRAVVAVDLARVRAVIDRIAADIDELARARRVQDLDTAAVLPSSRSAAGQPPVDAREAGQVKAYGPL